MDISDVSEINGVELDGFVPNGDLHIVFPRDIQVDYLRAVQPAIDLSIWASVVPRRPYLPHYWVERGADLEAMDHFLEIIGSN